MAGGDVQTDTLKAMENTDHYLRMRDSGHLDFIEKARLCRAFVEGYPNKQWDDRILSKLNAEGRPAMTINKVFPSIAATMGEQLQNQVDVAFRRTASGNDETAKALDIVWLHIANSNMLDWRRSEVFDDGAITGRGFYDMRISFDDNLRGDIRIRRLNNLNVLVDPDAESYDPDEWKECAITKWFSPAEIESLYDTAKAKELEMRAGDDFRLGHDLIDHQQTRFGRELGFATRSITREQKKLIRVIERQHKVLEWRQHFVDRVTGEVRAINSTWDRERIGTALQQNPEWIVARLQMFAFRWTVSAFDILLFDETSPYKHFTPVPYFPVLIGGSTIGLVENQISPQQVLNKTASQELHVVNSTANSGWKVKKGSLVNMDVYELEQRGAQTGLVLELNDMDGAEKIQPNQVPTGLDRISANARNDMFEISLVNKSQLGIDREDVSGKAMERKQLRGPINLGKPLANLVRTEHMLARNAVDLVQTFYTEERALAVTRTNRGRDTPAEIVINQTTAEGNIVNDVMLGEYQVITSTVNLREQQEDTEFDQASGLRQQGVDISDEELITLSRLRNKKEILERQEATAQARAEDLAIERQIKQAELEQAQTQVQVSKTDALEKVARARRTGEDAQVALLEKQAELVKLTTAMQIARNDEIRLELSRQELEIKREESRRKARLEQAKLRQTKATASARPSV